MSVIRPDLPAFGQTTAPAPSVAAREAQAAFFRTALGQGATPPAPAVVPASVAAPRIAPVATRAIPMPDPDRPLRPGSLLDIRI